MSFQEEMHQALRELQAKLKNGGHLEQKEMQLLFLTSMIEEEGSNGTK